MEKKILDNCTIYRLLDGMDKDTQRKLVSNALKNCQEEIKALEDLKQKEYTRLLALLNENAWDMKQISECLMSLYYFEKEIAECQRESKNASLREKYLDGTITLEEMQKDIHDAMEEEEREFYPTEYDYQLLRLLSLAPEEITLKDMENIKDLKAKSLSVKQNPPVCNYPN